MARKIEQRLVFRVSDDWSTLEFMQAVGDALTRGIEQLGGKGIELYSTGLTELDDD